MKFILFIFLVSLAFLPACNDGFKSQTPSSNNQTSVLPDGELGPELEPGTKVLEKLQVSLSAQSNPSLSAQNTVTVMWHHSGESLFYSTPTTQDSPPSLTFLAYSQEIKGAETISFNSSQFGTAVTTGSCWPSADSSYSTCSLTLKGWYQIITCESSPGTFISPPPGNYQVRIKAGEKKFAHVVNFPDPCNGTFVASNEETASRGVASTPDENQSRIFLYATAFALLLGFGFFFFRKKISRPS